MRSSRLCGWISASEQRVEVTFSSLPCSVASQSWMAWESKRMMEDDRDAPQAAVESDLSSVSEADSSTARRHKLSKLTKNKMEHLRAVKRRAQKRLGNVRSRGKGGSAKHLQGLVDDISAVLSPVQIRGHGGKFSFTLFL